MRGIILEVKKRAVIVLTPDNQYIKLRKENRIYSIGEELQFTLSGWRNVLTDWKSRLITTPHLSKPLIAGAGAFVLLISMLPLISTQSQQKLGSQRSDITQPMEAYVSLDINPSIELGVDAQLRVESVQSFNQDGAHVLSQIANWKEQSLDKVVHSIITVSDRDGFLKGDRHVLISSTIVQSDSKYSAILNESINKISKSEETSQHVTVNVLQGSSSTRKTSEALGMSEGKYLWYESAKQKGINMTLEHVKDTSVSNLDLEVNESLQKEAGKSANSNKGTEQTVGQDNVIEKMQSHNLGKDDAVQSTVSQSNMQRENKNSTGTSIQPASIHKGDTKNRNVTNQDEDNKNEDSGSSHDGKEHGDTHNTHDH